MDEDQEDEEGVCFWIVDRAFAQSFSLLGGPDYVFDRKEAEKGSVAGARQTDTQRCKVPVDSRKHESSCQCLEVHRPTCNR